MGYKPQRNTYALSFADRPGLEISMRSTSLGNLQKIMTTDRSVLMNNDAADEFFQKIVELIVSWNLVHPETHQACRICGLNEDQEMPISVDSLKCLDIEMVMEIVNAWGTAVIQVSMGKGMSSKNGEVNFPEELMKMLAEQQNPTKLPTPNFS